MLNVAICDDEINAIEKLGGILEAISKKHGIKIEVEDYISGEKLLNHMKKDNIRYDLIFLDIEMNQMNGLDTAKNIREIDERVYLIYVTGYKEYALKAYEAHPYYFIVKPISEEEIEKYFLKVYERVLSDGYFYEFQYKKDYYKILVNDIMYFESDRRRINIHLVDGSIYTYYDKLSIIEEKLKVSKADFWRIHQSFLVNAKYIRHKAFDYIELTNGCKFMISENRRKSVNIRYLDMVERRFIK